MSAHASTTGPPAYGPLVLRLGVGIVMAAHGWQKLTEMSPAGFGEGMLAGLDLPAPVVLGWVVTVIELAGGIALILGAATRIAAMAISVVLIGAIVLVKVDVGLIAPPQMGAGAELDLALLAGAIALALMGGGAASLDGAIGGRGASRS